MSDIGVWAHEYNKMNTSKIRIRGKLVRYTIPDVMTVYMGIGGDVDGDVVVETIRVFGPRERVSELLEPYILILIIINRKVVMSNLSMVSISKLRSNLDAFSVTNRWMESSNYWDPMRTYLSRSVWFVDEWCPARATFLQSSDGGRVRAGPPGMSAA